MRLVDACTRFPSYRSVLVPTTLHLSAPFEISDISVHDDSGHTSPKLMQAVSASCISCGASKGRCLVSLVTSLVLTKLDYCNSLLVGLPAKLLNRLQAVINTAARLVCHGMKADHITPVLKDLHWLRIHKRIQYKLRVIAFKCQHSLAPPYLSDKLQQVARMEPRQRLR